MSPLTDSGVLETVLRLHEENKKEWSKIATLLLDFNERLVIAEQSGKYAEQFRLLLLQEVTKVGDKVDKLSGLPREVEVLKTEVETLASTVKVHDGVFLQIQGGWIAARLTWTLIAALVAALTSYITIRFGRG